MTISPDVVAGRCPVCPAETPTRALGSSPDFEYGTTGPMEWQLVECTGCGSRLLDPCPADASIASLYPAEYEPYQFDALPRLVKRGRDWVQRSKVDHIASLVDTGATIVDLGCGSGSLLRLLSDNGDPSWKLIGWDFPGPHIEHLRDSGISVIAAAIEPGIWTGPSADLVILNQVIEHFRRPELIIEICHQLLGPGGHIVIETPDVAGLDAKLFKRRHWGGYHTPRHLVMFSQSGLHQMLAAHGFTVLDTTALLSPAFWVQSVHHWLTEQRGCRMLAAFFVVRNPLALALAAAVDFVVKRFRPTSNQHLVAQRR